jgi:hypothetical protein
VWTMENDTNAGDYADTPKTTFLRIQIKYSSFSPRIEWSCCELPQKKEEQFFNRRSRKKVPHKNLNATRSRADKSTLGQAQRSACIIPGPWGNCLTKGRTVTGGGRSQLLIFRIFNFPIILQHHGQHNYSISLIVFAAISCSQNRFYF